MAEVPVEYGKCVPVKYTVQEPASTVSLRNKFQCYQELSNSQGDMQVLQHAGCIGFNVTKQCSEECKSPTFHPEIDPQPLLVSQTKRSLAGNKKQSWVLGLGF